MVGSGIDETQNLPGTPRVGGNPARLGRTRSAAACSAMAAFIALASVASAQSLFTRDYKMPVDESGSADPDAPLREMSLLYIEAPKPKTFKQHDQVTIIIDENSSQSAKQTLDTKKDYSLAAALNEFPSLAALLDGQLVQGGTTGGIAQVDVTDKQNFKGEGTYNRTDKFTAKITATVLDVKPNGILVLEARKTIQKDDETTTITLTGRCRSEDITTSNTVLSSQLAELAIVSHNDGEVKDAGSKGWIPRILEAIFNF